MLTELAPNSTLDLNGASLVVLETRAGVRMHVVQTKNRLLSVITKHGLLFD